MSERDEKRSSKKTGHRDEINEEREAQKAIGRLKRDEERIMKRVKNKATSLSTSSALRGGHKPSFLPVPTPFE